MAGNKSECASAELAVLSWNTAGIKNENNTKMYELQKFINNRSEPFHIICLQETHYDWKSKPFFLKGYQKPICKNRDSEGGGVAIYVKNGLTFNEIKMNHSKNNKIETCGITIFNSNNSKLDIYCVYAPPPNSNNLENYQDIFGTNLNKNSIIVGDFNLKHPLWNPENDIRQDGESDDLIEFCSNLNLNIINDNQITRIASNPSHTDSAIDLAITSAHLQAQSDFYVIDNSFGSDHLPILVLIKWKASSPNTNKPCKWITNKAKPENWKTFQNLCKNNLNYNLEDSDIESNFATFYKILSNNLSKSMPKHKNGKKKQNQQMPWWTDECSSAVKKRENLRKKYKQVRSSTNLELFRQARTNAKTTIQKAKKLGWQNMCSELEQNVTSKKMWDLVRKMKGHAAKQNIPIEINNKIIIEPKDQANAFVKHFQKVSSDVGYPNSFLTKKAKIEDKFNKTFDSKPKFNDKSNYNKPFTFLEFEQALSNCKKGAPGPDEIHYDVIKNLPGSSKKLLLDLYNQSWNTGQTPSEWKIATIIPIPKPNKPKKDPSSYRPISLTSTFTKLMQKMIKSRLVYVLESKGLFSKSQSGCRNFHSCDDNLVRLESDIRKAQHTNKYVIAVFLDLSNAFDKMWNIGLLGYLHQIGIRGKMFYWIKDFLTGRKISVKCNGERSEIVETINGCPQGSVLSPVLFSLLMNTLSDRIDKHNALNKFDNINLSQFVDDSGIWTISGKPKAAVNKAQKALKAIEKWSFDFGFQINPSKTQVILFRKGYAQANITDELPKLMLCGQRLEFQKSVTLLGATLDQYLNWKPHVNNLINKCKKDLFLLRAISGQSWGADKKSLFRIYTALIRSKIDYASIAYNSASDSTLNKLQIIQNKALKIVTGSLRFASSNLLAAECATLPLKFQRELNMMKYWARSSRLNNTLPINDKIYEDPSFKANHKLKMPYAQAVQTLIKKFKLKGDEIAKPVYPFFVDLDPVKTDTNLSAVISKDNDTNSNRKTAQNHINKHYSNHLQIYTDGSKDRENEVAGGGLVAYKNGEILTKKSLKFDHRVSIFSCELATILVTLKYILHKSKDKSIGNKVAIMTDSLASVNVLNKCHSKSRPEMVHEIFNVCKQLANANIEITFIWIPSHIGLIGNETADELAKTGAKKGDIINIKLSLTEMYSFIKQEIFYDFRENFLFRHFLEKDISYPSFPSKITQYSNNRQCDTAYTSFRIKAHYIDFKYRTNPNCKHCGKLEDFNHVFFDCTAYKTHRENFKSSLFKLNLTIIDRTTLFFPPKGLSLEVREAVFKYLKAIRQIK